jgi:hypothetical protein
MQHVLPNYVDLLRWDQIEFRTATLHVRRVKQGTPSTHPPILDDELRALRRLQREQQPAIRIHVRAWHAIQSGRVARMIERAGIVAKLAASCCLEFGRIPSTSLARVRRDDTRGP